MTPRAFPKCECAAGYKIDPSGTLLDEGDGIVCLPTMDFPREFNGFVPSRENFRRAVELHRKEYRIPKGAWEIAFEVE